MKRSTSISINMAMILTMAMFVSSSAFAQGTDNKSFTTKDLDARWAALQRKAPPLPTERANRMATAVQGCLFGKGDQSRCPKLHQPPTETELAEGRRLMNDVQGLKRRQASNP